MTPQTHRLHSLPLRGRCHGDAVTEGAPCRRLGSHPALFGLISRRICRCRFRDFGIGGVWVVSFYWAKLTCFTSRMEKSITDLAKPMSFSSSGGKGCAQPVRARFRSHIFTKIRKVLLSSLREPSRSPLLPKRRITQTKSPHPNTVSPTHRKVRAARGSSLIRRLPSNG